MKVIAVNGTSNSGKTTICEVIIKGLRNKGYSVGSVKEIHCLDFALDPDLSTNTGRHKVAGSQLVTARAFSETDILYQSKLSMEEILKHYDYDYVILEGVPDCNAPRIITGHDEQELQERIDNRAIAISGVFANEHLGQFSGLPIFNAMEEPKALVEFVEKKAFRPLPSFDKECCGECGYSCRELAGKIAQNEAAHEDCVLFCQDVELFMDGTSVEMVPFVQAILKNAVLAVASELRGFKKQSKIEVRFRI